MQDPIDNENLVLENTYEEVRDAFSRVNQAYSNIVHDALGGNMLPPVKLFQDWDCIQKIIDQLKMGSGAMTRDDLNALSKKLPYPNENHDGYSVSSSAMLRLGDSYQKRYLSGFDFDYRAAQKPLNLYSYRSLDCFKEAAQWTQFAEEEHWSRIGEDILDIYSKQVSGNLYAFLRSKEDFFSHVDDSGRWNKSLDAQFKDGNLSGYSDRESYLFVTTYFLPVLVRIYADGLQEGVSRSKISRPLKKILEVIAGEKVSLPRNYQSLKKFEQSGNLLELITSKIVEQSYADVSKLGDWKRIFYKRLNLLLRQLDRLYEETPEFIAGQMDDGFFRGLKNVLVVLKNDIESLNKAPLDQISACFTGLVRLAIREAYDALFSALHEGENVDPTLFSNLDWLLECCFNTYRAAVPEATRSDIGIRRIPGDLIGSRFLMPRSLRDSFINREAESRLRREEAVAAAENAFAINSYLENVKKDFFNTCLNLEIKGESFTQDLERLNSILDEIIKAPTPQNLQLKMTELFVRKVFELYTCVPEFEDEASFFLGINYLGKLHPLRKGLGELLGKLAVCQALPDSSVDFDRLLEEKYGGSQDKCLRALLRRFQKKLFESKDFPEDFFVFLDISVRVDSYASVHIYTFYQEEDGIRTFYSSYRSQNEKEADLDYLCRFFDQELQSFELEDQNSGDFYRFPDVQKRKLERAIEIWMEHLGAESNDSSVDFSWD